jgi:hypothetical protein
MHHRQTSTAFQHIFSFQLFNSELPVTASKEHRYTALGKVPLVSLAVMQLLQRPPPTVEGKRARSWWAEIPTGCLDSRSGGAGEGGERARGAGEERGLLWPRCFFLSPYPACKISLRFLSALSPAAAPSGFLTHSSSPPPSPPGPSHA